MQPSRSSSQPLSSPSSSRQFNRTRSLPSTLSPQPLILARDGILQRKFRENNIPFGVQFEIARLISSSNDSRDLDFKQIADAVCTTRKPNVEGIDKLHSLIRGNPNLRAPVNGSDSLQSSKAASLATPWAAFDLEEKVLAIDSQGCIGHFELERLNLQDLKDAGEDLSRKYYYGGKVDFIAHLSRRKLNGSYSVSLRKAKLGQSNKLKRRFGSASLLKCNISEDLRGTGNEIVEFFAKRPLVLWDWVYRAISAKDNSIFFFRTNETLHEDGRLMDNNNRNGLSFRELIEWANPLERASSTISKWASRMTLALSTSVPGPLLDRDAIMFAEDIRSEDGSDMTDGCGYANLSFFKAIQERFALSEVPFAVQVRVFGAKGMLVCDPEQPDAGSPKIWLRPSQRKILFTSSGDDPSHRTVDILHITRAKTPARLSTEVIINLSHNGVPDDVFEEILIANLNASLEPLMEWGQGESSDMMRLWHVVDKIDSVSFKRQARQNVTELRFRGLQNDSSRAKEDELDEEEQTFSTWSPDPYSGCPRSISEIIVEMLSAGFNPQSSAFLRAKLYDLLKVIIRQKCSKHNWEIEQSATSFAIPDPYGVLGPDEIFFKSSRNEFVGANGLLTSIVTGNVLISRNPCKLPTDVRKVKAVTHPRLDSLVDCIVFPIKGRRRLIDFLAGGDYDGDRVMVIWDSTIVNHFTNAPESFAAEPPEVRECFNENTQKTLNYLPQLQLMDECSYISSIQRHLLSGLTDPYIIGQYSARHERLTYMYGLDDPRAVREAYMFCTVLDASKSGKKLLDNIRRQDIDLDPRRSASLPWRMVLEQISSQTNISPSQPRRQLIQQNNNGHVRFIMDVLSDVATEEYHKWMRRAENFFKGVGHATFQNGADPDLKAPWLTFDTAVRDRNSEDLRDDRKTIQNFVQNLHEEFSNRLEISRNCSRRFSSFFPGSLRTFMDKDTASRLLASYAYYYCMSNTQKPFPWSMAFRELCLIKARASSSGFATVVTEFGDNYRLARSSR